ncbi:MAG: Ca2+-dependent phosphoinositide-specific phospholipase C [Actinomycetota bacterium]|nr:Ca2+-dependent phosphoinositide-specific phospholipase C [Actinomycetota bacterium]
MADETDDLRYDEAIRKVSHNSYARDERPLTEQLAWDRHEPHDGGCRGLELDLCESPNLPMWAIDHDGWRPDADHQLAAYLRHLRRWSELEAGHHVVTVTLDLKPPVRNPARFATYLDATLAEHLGADRLYTPAELRGGATSLVAGATATGWPTLGELRGRFVLCLSGDEDAKRAYLDAEGDRLCFADQRVRRSHHRPSTTGGDRVFFNVNATESWAWDRRVARWFAPQPGFVTRAYVVNSPDLWDRAIAAGVNLIATDKVRNHRWATVGPLPFAGPPPNHV